MTLGAWMPGWAVRLICAAVSGGLMYAAFPPRDLWFLAPVSLGVLYAVLRVGRPRVRVGALAGFVFGLAFFVPLLPWIGEYVGALPWLALAVVMALYTALFGAVATLVERLRAAPVWFAVAWVGAEAVRASFPFGGFPWGRAAFSQTSGLLLPLASLVGAPGLSFAVAFVGAGAAAAVLAAIDLRRDGSRLRPLAGVTALGVPLLVGGVLGVVATPGGEPDSTVDVAAVQGNVPRLGLDFNAQRRAVLDNHVAETRKLAREVDEGRRRKPDLVLWPENASDISPAIYPEAGELVASAVDAARAPILFGTLMPNGDGGPSNSVLVWGRHGGVADDDFTGRYDKHIIQPFGEYLPWRDFFRHFSSYADRAGNFQPGSGPAVLTAQTDDGPVTIGISTCWEVAFDRSPRQAVDDGAQFLFVPTNNATFGLTDMSSQQLAMSQIRAVETGRDVAVVATSGLSALIASDGTVMQESGLFEPAVLQRPLGLRHSRTLAVTLGPWPERAALLTTVLSFLYALARTTSLDVFGGRRRSPEGPKEHDERE